MIVYKKRPKLARKQLKNFYFVADSQEGTAPEFKLADLPNLMLYSSEMRNLNWGKATRFLSFEGSGLHTLYGYPQVPYEPFDNLGIVLNL